RQVQLAGVLEGRLEILDDLLAALGELVRRLEAVVHVDGQSLRREVGDVADRGAHIEGAPQELRDRLGLRRGFDDDQRLGHRSLFATGWTDPVSRASWRRSGRIARPERLRPLAA